MMKVAFAILLILFVAYVLIDKEHDAIMLKAKDKVYADSIAGLREQFREILQEDSITAIEYSLLKQEVVTAVSNANYYQKKYEKEKNRPVVRYPATAVDSVLSAIYPR